MALIRLSERFGTRDHETWSIESVRDYIKFVDSEIESRKHIYRGQSDEYQLRPTILRIVSAEHDVRKTELDLFHYFTQQAIPYLQYSPNQDWDWLSIAQHHSLPTRLLDWTSNPLAGLWFAVKKSYSAEFEKSESGVVWCYRVDENDKLGADDLEKMSPFDISRIRIFYPRHISPRIKAQQALFTAHPIQDESSRKPLEWLPESKRLLVKVSIPKSCFPAIRQQLADIGVNSATMFPDLDGLAQHLTWHQTIWSHGDNYTGP